MRRRPVESSWSIRRARVMHSCSCSASRITVSNWNAKRRTSTPSPRVASRKLVRHSRSRWPGVRLGIRPWAATSAPSTRRANSIVDLVDRRRGWRLPILRLVMRRCSGAWALPGNTTPHRSSWTCGDSSAPRSDSDCSTCHRPSKFVASGSTSTTTSKPTAKA